ncbi:MAG: tetratricopeptide repeat protein [Deltaproteobacteria bacterium]|nr:tetratricopeptide repeat protein [Deltaproteobacteria bacterium]
MHFTNKIKMFFLMLVCCALLAPSASGAIPLTQQPKLPESKHQSAIDLLKKSEYEKVITMESQVIKEDPKDLTAYFLLTIAYLGNNNEKKAIEQAEAVMKIDVDFASDIYGGMGRFYITKRRYHKALHYLLESLKIKDDPEVIKNIGSIYLSQGLLKNAKTYYEKLLTIRPDYVNLSRIYLAEENFKSAIDYADKAVKEDVRASGGYLVLGTGYILTGDMEQAKVNFKILKELNPDFFLTEYFLGLINTIEGEYDEALLEFGKLSAASPKLKEPFLNTAAIWHLKGNLEKAKEAAAKAIEIDPFDYAGHLAMANIHISEKDYEKANSEFSKAGDFFADFNIAGFKASALFSDETASTAQLTLATLYNRAGLYMQAVKAAENDKSSNPLFTITKARAEAKLGNHKKAQELYTAILAKHPGMIAPHIELADLYDIKNDYRQAIEHYNEAGKKAVGLIKINTRLAEIYQKSGKKDLALEEYKKAVAASPQSINVYLKITHSLTEAGANKDALEYAMKGAAINPEDEEMKDALGWIYFKLGRYDEALEAYSGILKNGTANPVIYYHMGLLFQKLKHNENAIEAFEKALNINEEFPHASETKWFLKKLTGIG